MKQSLPKQEDEFTLQDYQDRAKTKGMDMAASTSGKRLRAMVAEGKLTSRNGVVKGCNVLFYKIVK